MKRLLFIPLVLGIVISLFLLLGIKTDVGVYAADGNTFTLFAGQNTEVGEVVVDDGNFKNLLVTYKLIEGYCLLETHLHIGNDIPMAGGKTKNPVPGKFEYSLEHDCKQSYTYEIPWDEVAFGETVIAAHAAVEQIPICSTIKETPYYAYKVGPYEQGTRYDETSVKTERSNPDAVLSYTSTSSKESDFFSLGFDGWLEIEFEFPILNGIGYDFQVVEDTWGLPYPYETAETFVKSEITDEWVLLGEANNQNLINSWHTITNFDLGDLSYAKYVKIKDVSKKEDFVAKYPAQAATLDGFDLNALISLQNYFECTMPKYETAWAGNLRFNDKGNWATYFTYDIQAPENFLKTAVYEGYCDTFGTGADETLTFTFTNDVVCTRDYPHVIMDGVSTIGTGPLTWKFKDNIVTITSTGAFKTPRPKIGDIVKGFNYITDTLGNPVLVPVEGIEIEGKILVPSWTGTWDTMFDSLYPTTLTLTQDGNSYTGNYSYEYDGSLVEGNVWGSIDGLVLSGNYNEGYGDGDMEFIMSCDGNSFTGSYDRSGVWNGVRQ